MNLALRLRSLRRPAAASLAVTALLAATTPPARAANFTLHPVGTHGGKTLSVCVYADDSGKSFDSIVATAIGAVVTIRIQSGLSEQEFSFPFAAPVTALETSGDHVFVALAGGGLAVIRTDGMMPEIVAQSTMPTSSPAVLAFDAPYLHSRDGVSGLVVSVDVTDPASPQVVSQIPVAFSSPLPTLAAGDGRLAFGDGFGTAILNTTVFPFTPAFGIPGPCDALAIDDGHVVRASFNLLQVFGANAPGPPVVFVPLTIPITGLASFERNTLLFDLSSQVRLVDWTNAASPALHGPIALPTTAGDPLDARDVGLSRRNDGSWFAAAAMGNRTTTLSWAGDLFDDMNIVVERTGGTARAIGVAGGLTAIAWGEDRLEFVHKLLRNISPSERHWVFFGAMTNVEFAIPASNGSNPPSAERAAFDRRPLPTSHGPIVYAGGLGFRGCRVGLDDTTVFPELFDGTVWDLEIVNRPGEGPNGATLQLAFVMHDPTGMNVVDVTNPESPQTLGTLPDFVHALDLAVEGSLAAIALGPAGCALIDVTDPAAPVPLTTIPGETSCVAISGDVLWRGIPGAIQAYDVASPASPSFLGEEVIAPPADLQDLVVENRVASGGETLGVVWVAAGPAGVLLYSVADPADPVLLAELDTPGEVNEVAICGARILVADGTAGALELRLESEAETPRAELASGSLLVGPNPFRDSTSIAFLASAGADPVAVEIHDVTGRRVARFDDAPAAAGRSRFAWDGRDTRGTPLPAGCYFVTARKGAAAATEKVFLVR